MSDPCFAGGTCTEGNDDTFTCTCPTGAAGELCESGRLLACLLD